MRLYRSWYPPMTCTCRPLGSVRRSYTPTQHTHNSLHLFFFFSRTNMLRCNIVISRCIIYHLPSAPRSSAQKRYTTLKVVPTSAGTYNYIRYINALCSAHGESNHRVCYEASRICYSICHLNEEIFLIFSSYFQ